MGQFSSACFPRNFEKNIADRNGKTSLEMRGLFPFSVADIHNNCFSPAVDLIPLNIINSIKGQTINHSNFIPSDIALGLLFPKTPKEMKPPLFEYCKNQFSNGFVEAIEHIRERQSKGLQYVFLVASADGRINIGFMEEIQKHLSLPKEARFSDFEFILRYGEELVIWASKHIDIIKKHGLQFSLQGCLILVCKEKKIIYHEGAD